MKNIIAKSASLALLVCLLTSPAWADKGEITKFDLLNPNSEPHAIMAGPDRNLWLSQQHANRSLGLPTPATADLYHAATDFSATDNPNGVWSYGWSPALGGKFTLYTQTDNYKGLTGWRVPSEQTVSYNPTDRVIQFRDIFWEPGDMTFHPGPSGEHSVVRWTAPADGYVAVYVTFATHDRSGNGDTTVHVLGNSQSLFDGRVRGYGRPESFAEFYTKDYLWVSAGDTIDFDVGPNGPYDFDTVKLDAWIAFEAAK